MTTMLPPIRTAAAAAAAATAPAPGAHTRENHGILARAEKAALIWIVTRLPRWVTSDQLTLLGLIGMASAGAAFWATRWWPFAPWLVCAALVVNWFGDSLDGTLARVRNRQRPRYGFYVDHVIDLVGALFLLGGLALSGAMHPIVACALLIGYLMVTAESFLATHVLGTFRMSFAGFGPTELRIVLMIGALRLLRGPIADVPLVGMVKLFDVGGLIALVGLAIAFIVSSVRNTRALQRAEPLPR
jgi:phosphatidylglycerophosphate synthase